jgi:mono/diheme cytochrome c family protein
MVMVFLFRPNSYSGLDGEKLFTAKCGKCHASGSAPVFSPVKYASSQWERFFEKDKHKRKKDISQEVTAEELEAIKQYLVDHAADSDRPVAAGLK